MISLRQVSYVNTNAATTLEEISLDFTIGNIYAIVGANGAGKSTLLDILSGIKRPSTGKLLYKEQDIHQKRSSFLKYIENIGYCIQNPDSAFFHKTVQDEILFSTNSQKNLQSAVDQYGLQDVLHLSPFQLSGGQKKRLLFALNLLSDPSVLLMDELTAGLDREGERKITEELLHNKDKRITIMTTHNLDDAFRYADYLIALNHNKVSLFDTPKQIIENPEKITSLGFAMPETIKICQGLIQANIFEEGQYLFNQTDIAEQILKKLQGASSHET